MRIFMRDGFVDRYSGEHLVFPPVLRLLTAAMPTVFPFHRNWKMSDCHVAYWHLMPTVDHIVPIARGGADTDENQVCTSQLRNSAKSNWLLTELGWMLHQPGDIRCWDGLMSDFLKYAQERPEILEDDYVRAWYRAARRVTG